MNKPDIEIVLRIVRMKQEASELYAEIDREVQSIKNNYGAGRYDYDLEAFLDEMNDGYAYDESLMKDGRYLKFEVIDNLEAMKNGDGVWTSVTFKPVTFSARSLKRCPDSLKS